MVASQTTDAGAGFPVIEGYEILSEIHGGAQGVVYKAIQTSTKRIVALKVMLSGPYASGRQQRRFEREIDLVAGLNHPNIVTLFDSGHVDGRLYFAMQYIAGQALNEYLAVHPLTTKEKLALFIKVCRGVNHAHQRGIIHRDLKPSNICVDGDAQPHVLDFGLAKLADGVRTSETLKTCAGEFIGTLAYASPEQVSGEPDAVDIRSDVYSLGVILYEMVAGRHPYPVDGPMSTVVRNITEARPLEPSNINRRIDDELATIVLTALAKESDRRYQSVGNLSQDIEHYLAGLPIDAKRDSALYVLKKTMIRHKVAVMFAVAFVILLSVSLVVATVGWRQATRQRDRADQHAAELRHTLYSQRIALAQNAYDSHNIARLYEVLDQCPPYLRGWEWHYLRRVADDSEMTCKLAGGVNCVAVSPDGRHVVSGSADKLITIWDAKTGRKLRTLAGHGGGVLSLAFSPDGKRVVSGSKDQTARIWDIADGREILAVTGHKGGEFPGVHAVAFSPDAARIATGGGDNVLRLWDAATGKLIRRFPFPPVAAEPYNYVRFVVFSPDGSRMISGGSGSGDSTLRIWNAHTGQEERVLGGYRGAVTSADFSPDGKRIVSASLDKTLKVWETETGKEVLTLKGHQNWILSVSFFQDAKQIVSGSKDSTIRIWDARTGAQLRTLTGHTSPVTCVAISPDGDRIFSSSDDATLKFWHTRKSKKYDKLQMNIHRGAVGSAALAPDGRHVASGDLEDKKLRLYDIRADRQIWAVAAHQDAIPCVAYAPDGATILTASKDKTLRTWDAETGEALRTFSGHTDEVFCGCFSPDGGKIVSASNDKSVKVWDARTGKAIREFVCDASVWEVAFSPAGGHVAFGGEDKVVTLWDPATGRTVHTLSGHEAEIDALAFSPDGKRIVSGAWDANPEGVGRGDRPA